MTLLAVWLHLAAVVVWIGGVSYQLVALLITPPGERASALLDAARRARPVTWTAVSVVVLTGFYNVTRLGPLADALEGGAAVVLAGKFILVIAAITLAGQRDFAQVPRATGLLKAGADPAPALAAIARLDGLVLALAAVIIYLGLALSRR